MHAQVKVQPAIVTSSSASFESVRLGTIGAGTCMIKGNCVEKSHQGKSKCRGVSKGSSVLYMYFMHLQHESPE